MKDSFLTNGDAYARALLADGFLAAHHRFVATGQLAPGDARWFEGARDFLENAYQGFLRTLSTEEASELGKEQPPISKRRFTSAFKLAMMAWNSEKWATVYPRFRISRKNVDQELSLYISAINRTLEIRKGPEAIEGLARTRDFFAELGKAALASDEEKDLLPLNLSVMAKLKD